MSTTNPEAEPEPQAPVDQIGDAPEYESFPSSDTARAADSSAPKSKKPRNPLLIGAIAAVAGLVVGGAIAAAILVPRLSSTQAQVENLTASNAKLSAQVKTSADEAQSTIEEYTQKQLDLQTQADDIKSQSDALKAREDAVKKREDAVTAAENGLKATTFGAGTYQVGRDIQPGTYRNDGGDGCYWARLSSGSGDLDSILANDNPGGPTTVMISPSDWGFENNRCGTWTKIG